MESPFQIVEILLYVTDRYITIEAQAFKLWMLADLSN
jgi:hypothetical protein